jgi:Na+-driven multidrug efflux pump
MEVIIGSLRGMGQTIAPTIVSLLGACGLRIVWIYSIFQIWQTLPVLYISYPVSWIITSLVQLVMCLIYQRKFQKRVDAMRAAQNSASEAVESVVS